MYGNGVLNSEYKKAFCTYNLICYGFSKSTDLAIQ